MAQHCRHHQPLHMRMLTSARGLGGDGWEVGAVQVHCSIANQAREGGTARDGWRGWDRRRRWRRVTIVDLRTGTASCEQVARFPPPFLPPSLSPFSPTWYNALAQVPPQVDEDPPEQVVVQAVDRPALTAIAVLLEP